MSTTETERYVRITLLTFEGGLWISKKILFREIDRTPGSPTLDALLLSKKPQLTQKRNRREITKRQYETVFPVSGGDTDVEEWDLSLLIKIVLFLFEHSLPGQESYHLNEILRIRNEVVCHARHPSVEEREFNTHWTQLTIRIYGLTAAFDVNTQQYASDLVQRLSSGPLDLQSSIERVAQLCRNDEHMEQMLESLATLQRQLNKVETGVVDANRKLDDVLARLQELIRMHETDEEGQCRVEVPMLNSTVVLTGKKEDVVKLAANVLRKVIQSSIDKVEDQNDDEKIQDAVQKLLADIESNGGTADSTESGSIILKIRCETLMGLHNMLNFFRIYGRTHRLVEIEKALSAMFQEEINVEIGLSEDTLDRMKTWIDESFSTLPRKKSEDEVQEYKRSIHLGIKCDSAEAAVDVIKYLKSGESANRLNQIAEAVSEVAGDTIKIEARPDVEGFSRAFSANTLLAASTSRLGETTVENESSQVESVSRAPLSPPPVPQQDRTCGESLGTTTASNQVTDSYGHGYRAEFQCVSTTMTSLVYPGSA